MLSVPPRSPVLSHAMLPKAKGGAPSLGTTRSVVVIGEEPVGLYLALCLSQVRGTDVVYCPDTFVPRCDGNAATVCAIARASGLNVADTVSSLCPVPASDEVMPKAPDPAAGDAHQHQGLADVMFLACPRVQLGRGLDAVAHMLARGRGAHTLCLLPCPMSMCIPDSKDGQRVAEFAESHPNCHVVPVSLPQAYEVSEVSNSVVVYNEGGSWVTPQLAGTGQLEALLAEAGLHIHADSNFPVHCALRFGVSCATELVSVTCGGLTVSEMMRSQSHRISQLLDEVEKALRGVEHLGERLPHNFKTLVLDDLSNYGNFVPPSWRRFMAGQALDYDGLNGLAVHLLGASTPSRLGNANAGLIAECAALYDARQGASSACAREIAELGEKISSAALVRFEVSEALGRVQASLGELELNQLDCQSRVRDYFDTLVNVARRREESLLAELASLTEARSARLAGQAGDLESQLERLNDAVAQATNATDASDPAHPDHDAAHARALASARLQAVLTSLPPAAWREPCASTQAAFATEVDFLHMISAVCAIAATSHEAEQSKQAGMRAVFNEIRAKQAEQRRDTSDSKEMVPHGGEAHLEEPAKGGGCTLM